MPQLAGNGEPETAMFNRYKLSSRARTAPFRNGLASQKLSIHLNFTHVQAFTILPLHRQFAIAGGAELQSKGLFSSCICRASHSRTRSCQIAISCILAQLMIGSRPELLAGRPREPPTHHRSACSRFLTLSLFGSPLLFPVGDL